MFDNFEALKREVEDVTRKRDKAAGALEQVLKRLKKDFGCRTLKEAKAKLVALEEQERKAAKDYTAKKEEFEKKWKQVLERL